MRKGSAPARSGGAPKARARHGKESGGRPKIREKKQKTRFGPALLRKNLRMFNHYGDAGKERGAKTKSRREITAVSPSGGGTMKYGAAQQNKKKRKRKKRQTGEGGRGTDHLPLGR